MLSFHYIFGFESDNLGNSNNSDQVNRINFRLFWIISDNSDILDKFRLIRIGYTLDFQ